MNDNRCHCAIYHSVNIEHCRCLAYFILPEPGNRSYPPKPSRALISLASKRVFRRSDKPANSGTPIDTRQGSPHIF